MRVTKINKLQVDMRWQVEPLSCPGYDPALIQPRKWNVAPEGQAGHVLEVM